MRPRGCFRLFVLCFLTRVTLSQVGIDRNDLGDLYKALTNALSFCNNEYHNLDSNALLGLRVAQGYIHRILADTENGEIKLNQDIYSSMINLLNRTTEVVERMLPFLWKQDPLFYPMLNSSWTYFKPYKFLEPQDVVERQKIKSGDEEKYSNCVGEIVGSKESSMEPCTISDDCWGIMKSKGAPNKVLYYQALFFLLGEASGCHHKLLSRIKSSGDNLETHLQHICTLAYFTNSRALFYGEDGDSVDLMLTLKLSFSCGLLGYYELLTGEGLGNVIGWQLNSGCFGDNSIIDEEKTSETNTGKGRRELRSSYLGKGCFSDITGVGIGLLSLYLRWVLDPPPQVQPVDLIESAKEDAQTISVYMYILLLVTAAFLFAIRGRILEMVSFFRGTNSYTVERLPS